MIDDELDLIMQVMKEAFDPAFGEAWTRRQVSDALVLPGNHVLLAAENGLAPSPGERAAGFVLSRSTIEEEEMLLVAVSPAMRRQGIATGMINRFLEEAKERGAEQIFLEMREGNPAETLYRRMGFDEIGRRPNYYRHGPGEAIDALTFGRKLKI